ncbi:hypothetical protein PtB15_11B73 [Puccinia triticina]|nr:hypothetical protein PtB15_11B73 [Puccinia triticina]
MNFYCLIPVLLLAALSAVISADPDCSNGNNLYCFSAAEQSTGDRACSKLVA